MTVIDVAESEIYFHITSGKKKIMWNKMWFKLFNFKVNFTDQHFYTFYFFFTKKGNWRRLRYKIKMRSVSWKWIMYLYIFRKHNIRHKKSVTSFDDVIIYTEIKKRALLFLCWFIGWQSSLLEDGVLFYNLLFNIKLIALLTFHS